MNIFTSIKLIAFQLWNLVPLLWGLQLAHNYPLSTLARTLYECNLTFNSKCQGHINVVTWIFAVRAPLNQKMEQSASHHWNLCVNSVFNSVITTILCAAIALFVAKCSITFEAEELESVNFCSKNHYCAASKSKARSEGPSRPAGPERSGVFALRSCAATRLETMPADSGEHPKLQKTPNFERPKKLTILQNSSSALFLRFSLPFDLILPENKDYVNTRRSNVTKVVEIIQTIKISTFPSSKIIDLRDARGRPHTTAPVLLLELEVVHLCSTSYLCLAVCIRS